MRLIDADALGVGRCSKELLPAAYCAGWNGLVNLIEQAPTIDAVPVIRCKQCRFWDEDKKGFSDECLCKRWSTEGVADYFTEPESFCSYADLKE